MMLCRRNKGGFTVLQEEGSNNAAFKEKTKTKKKRKMRWTTNPCESKRLWGLYLAEPCGNDKGHLGSKRTTIHLNPGLPGKTHNPPNTHDPRLDRQREKNGTLKRWDKTKQYPFLPFLFRLSVII